MADRKLFEYNLQDAWQMPISSVTILQDQNIVFYTLPRDGAEKFPPQDPKSVEISNETMEKVIPEPNPSGPLIFTLSLQDCKKRNVCC